MAITSRTVAVTDEATRVDTADTSENASDGYYGQTIAVLNDSAATVYLGGPDVTTDNGYPLPADGQIAFDLTPRDQLYAVTESTGELRVLETGV